MALPDPKTIFYYIIDNAQGVQFPDLLTAQAQFDLPNSSPEKILVQATVLKKKVQVLTEVTTT